MLREDNALAIIHGNVILIPSGGKLRKLNLVKISYITYVVNNCYVIVPGHSIFEINCVINIIGIVAKCNM